MGMEYTCNMDVTSIVHMSSVFLHHTSDILQNFIHILFRNCATMLQSYTGEAIMSIEQVRLYLAEYGRDSGIIEFPESSATVALAADALGVAGARIAKTLSFVQGDGCLLIIAAGDARIDNKRFKERFSMKPRMLDPHAVVELTGHAVGGVCPFALPSTCTVYADVSLRRFETVFPACGSVNSAIELPVQELFEIAHCKDWVDVCSSWNIMG